LSPSVNILPGDVGPSEGSKHVDEKDQNEVTVETLVEDVSIDGMCGVY
jgi:mycofactocin precursor